MAWTQIFMAAHAFLPVHMPSNELKTILQGLRKEKHCKLFDDKLPGGFSKISALPRAPIKVLIRHEGHAHLAPSYG